MIIYFEATEELEDDGVDAVTSLTIEANNLEEVAHLFLRALNVMGYTYVTNVTLHKQSGDTVGTNW